MKLSTALLVTMASASLLAAHAADAEPTDRNIALFYLAAYEGAQGYCPDMSSLPETTEPIRHMLKGDMGQLLGIHSTSGAISEMIDDEPEAAAALWAGGIISMAGDERGCAMLDLVLTKPPAMTEQLLKN